MVDYSDRPNRMDNAFGDTIAKAIMTLTRAMEPRINEIAVQATNRAVGEGQRVARRVYRRVREEPWYLIGAAAVLLVTAAIFFSIGPHDEMREIGEDSDPEPHLH